MDKSVPHPIGQGCFHRHYIFSSPFLSSVNTFYMCIVCIFLIKKKCIGPDLCGTRRVDESLELRRLKYVQCKDGGNRKCDIRFLMWRHR